MKLNKFKLKPNLFLKFLKVHFFSISILVLTSLAFLSIVIQKSEKDQMIDQSLKKSQQMISSIKYASIPSPTPTPTPQPIKTAQPQIPLTPVINTPPASGYSLQTVSSDMGIFQVAIISADLNTTKVIVDTASPSDCSNNCPVLSLADYVSRNNAIAGINGSFFCPAEYPSCAGKTNSFDTLLMNKNKVYFNSSNNVYSTIPAVIFQGNGARFVSQSLEWGRDTSPDAVIANYPLLVKDGNINYSGSAGEPKFEGSGTRDFIGATGSTVYIGIVYGATMIEAAHVLHSLGIANALNLDEGGSTALWDGSYLAGPGRNIPNAVLLVRR